MVSFPTDLINSAFHLWAIKWRGYFWHVLVIQIKIDILHEGGPIARARDRRIFTQFIQHVDQTYDTTPLADLFGTKPLITSGIQVSVRQSSKNKYRFSQARTTDVEC